MIPDKVKIGPFPYSVKIVQIVERSDPAVQGIISYLDQEIRIQEGQGPERTEWIFWHEALHGMLHSQAIALKEEEVEGLSYALYLFLKDNGYAGGGLPDGTKA